MWNVLRGALLAQRAASALEGGAWEMLWEPRREDLSGGTPRFSTLQKVECTRRLKS